MRHPEADSLALELRTTLTDVFEPRDIRRGQDSRSWEFIGTLTVPANLALDQLIAPFARLGFAPFLRRHQDQDIIIAVPASAVAPAPTRWGLHLVLLLLTLATLTASGALLQAARGRGTLILSLGTVLDALEQHGRSGLTFAGALLLILGAHEMGHYLSARRHRMQITLPFFLPAPPPPWGLGTLGAVIAMRSPIAGRRPLLDVALAGPLAGLLVAVPVLILGLQTAPTGNLAVPVTPPLLAGGLARLLRGAEAAGQIDWFHPLLFAAWLGLLVTAINLLPIGQLDGGHIAYAALGPRAVWVAGLAWVGLLALVPLSPNWAVYALVLLAVGLRHPAPQDDITPLDPRRRAWTLVALVLFALTFSPTPIP